MGIRETIATRVRALADKLGPPAFAGTPFPQGTTTDPVQLKNELGSTGSFLFGGFLKSGDDNPEMDGQTAIKNFDIMRRSDSQVHAALEVVKLPIRTATYELDPSDPDDAEARQIADFVEWNLFERMTVSWDDVIRQALLMLDFGFMLFEKVWTVEDKGEYAGMIVLNKLAPRPPKTIWQWFTDVDGSLISIKQLAVKAGTYQFLDIPVSKLVRFTFQQEGDDFMGISMLRTAYPHWLIKKNLYVIDAIRAQRYGVGIPRAKLQPGYRPTEEDKSAMATMLQGLSSHQHGFLIEPEQVVVDILMPQGTRGGVQIMDSVNHQNEQITRNILAQFLDMGGKAQGGSRALGASAMDFFLNAIQSIADQICEVLNKQLIKDLVDMNFDTDKYPTLRPSGIKETDPAAIAQAAAQLAGAGLLTPDPKTENTIRQMLDLPERPEAELAAQQAAIQQQQAASAVTPPNGATPPAAPHPPGSAVPTHGTPAHSAAPAGDQPAVHATIEHHSAATPHVGTAQVPAVASGPSAQAVLPPDAVAQPGNVVYDPHMLPGVYPATAATTQSIPAQHAVTQTMPAKKAVEADDIQPNGMDAATGASGWDAPTVTRPTDPWAEPYRGVEAPRAIDLPATATNDPSRDATQARSSLTSSGDADEEGHTSNAKGLKDSRQPRGRRSKKLQATPIGEFWRRPTTQEAAILALREIPHRLDIARADLRHMLEGVREEQVSRLASTIARAKPGDSVKPPLVGKMAADLAKTMREVYDYGHKQVYAELNKQRRNNPALRLFDENQPRDEGGRWTSTGANFSSYDALPEKYHNVPGLDLHSAWTPPQAATEGVTAAFSTLEKINPALAAKLKDKVSFVGANYEPHAFMTTISNRRDPNAKLYILLNGLGNPVEMAANPGWVVGDRTVNLKTPGGLARLYQLSTEHELGHAIDAIVGAHHDALSDKLVDAMSAKFGEDGDAAAKWISQHVSKYAATNPGDAVAESVVMLLDGQKLPPELSFIEDAIRKA